MDKLLSLTIPGNNGPVNIEAPAGVPSGVQIGPLITLFLQLALTFGIILSGVYLMYGGIYWIQSKGNKETLDKARRIIIYSIVGLIVMSLSLVIVTALTSALGISSFFGERAPIQAIGM